MAVFTTRHYLFWTFLVVNTHVISGNKGKSSIFDADPIRFQDFGKPPATSTIPLYDCSVSHRPKAGTPSAFEVSRNKEWHTHACQEGLIWNQTMCRCEFPNGKTFTVQCRDYRTTSQKPTGKYEQFVNGQWIVRDCSLAVAGLVWSQEACQCVWGPKSKEMVIGRGITPCDIMLNMTFEDGIKDNAKNSFVEVKRGGPVQIITLNKRESVNGNKAAYFNDTALNVWHFAGNEMGTSLRVEFRFKMISNPVQKDKYQIFISNGCNMSAPGYTTPSLAIGYRAADQSYLLAFETTSARKAIVCTRKLGAYDWHTVSLIYEDGILLFRVDDQPCIISQDFSGPVQKTPCPLTIGADPLVRESVYNGYIDNLLIARYCQRFIDTDQTGPTDKSQGPMPVEPVGSLKNVRKETGKHTSNKGGHKHIRVTSTKYMSELPTLRNTEAETTDVNNSDNYGKVNEYIESIKGSEKTGFDNPGTSPDNINYINEDSYFENEWSSYKQAVESGHDFRSPESISGKATFTMTTEGLGNEDDLWRRSGHLGDSSLSEITGRIANDIHRSDKKGGQNNVYEMKEKYKQAKPGGIFENWENENDFVNSKQKGQFEQANRNTIKINRHQDNDITDKNAEYGNSYESFARTRGTNDRIENSERNDEIERGPVHFGHNAGQKIYLDTLSVDSDGAKSEKHSHTFVGINKNNRAISSDLINDNTRQNDNNRNINKQYVRIEDDESYGNNNQNLDGNIFVGDVDSLGIFDGDRHTLSSNQNVKKRTDDKAEFLNEGQFNRYEKSAVNTDHALSKIIERSDRDVKSYGYKNGDAVFHEGSDNIQAELSTKSVNPGDNLKGLTKSTRPSSDIDNIHSESTDSSNVFDHYIEESKTSEGEHILSTDKHKEIEKQNYLNSRLHWYDNGEGPKHLHLTGINLSQGSAFIMDTNNRRKQRPHKPRQKLIKGRRRSGSKKNNWYDKTDTPKDYTKASIHSQDQNSHVRQYRTPTSSEKAVANKKEEIISSVRGDFMEDISDYSTAKTTNSKIVSEDYANDKSSSHHSSQDSDIYEEHENNRQTLSSPKTLAARKKEPGNGLAKSTSERSTGNHKSLDYPQEDHKVHIVEDLTDRDTNNEPSLQGTKFKHINNNGDESRSDKQLGRGPHSLQQNTDTAQIWTKENSTPIMGLNRVIGLFNQNSIQMISPYNGNEYEKSHAGEVSKRHLDIPASATKVKNAKSWKKDDQMMTEKVKMIDE